LSKPTRCPDCLSTKTWKDGHRYAKEGRVQRYICRSCGFRFSKSSSKLKVEVNVSGKAREPSNPGSDVFEADVHDGRLSRKDAANEPPLMFGEDVGSHKVTIAGKDINSLDPSNYPRQVCASEDEAKNLAKVETRTVERPAGGTKTDSAKVKGTIFEFKWKMKREGYSESTISCYSYILETLAKRGANIFDPENVKDIIALQETWSNSRKSIVVKAYTLFLKLQSLKWKPPKYKPVYKLPYIPTEKDINDLIAGCHKKVATFLQLLKETAMRRGEAFKLEWTDIDPETKIVRILPEKGSNPRVFKISNKLATMLNNLPKTTNRVFDYKDIYNLEKTFRKQRKRIAFKLGNPKIKQIHFHTFRHWKATMLYAKTNNILEVKQFLGHKSLRNTEKYTQLIVFKNDEYVCKMAKTVKEASKLIEAGYDHVTEMDGYQLFRKSK